MPVENAVLTTTRSVEVERTPTLIRRGDREAYLLVINFNGRNQMVQDRKVGPMGPGDMVLLHSSQPFASQADMRRPYQVGSVVMLESSALPIPAQRLRPLVAVQFLASDGIVSLVSRHLYTLGTSQIDPADVGRLWSVTMDLVSLDVRPPAAG